MTVQRYMYYKKATAKQTDAHANQRYKTKWPITFAIWSLTAWCTWESGNKQRGRQQPTIALWGLHYWLMYTVACAAFTGRSVSWLVKWWFWWRPAEDATVAHTYTTDDGSFLLVTSYEPRGGPSKTQLHRFLSHNVGKNCFYKRFNITRAVSYNVDRYLTVSDWHTAILLTEPWACCK